MYFNLDHQRKQKILKYYQKAADEYRRKKEEEKKLKIQEELNELYLKEQKQIESDVKLSQENNRKKKTLMNEYLEMLQKTKNNQPGYHFKPKNNEVIINNWGKTKEEFLNENNNNNIYFNKNKNKNKSFDSFNHNPFNSFNTLDPIEKAKIIIKPIDSMKKFLTDEQNEKEVNTYFLKQKQNKLNFYKELLFSQYKKNQQKNKNIFGTEDILILKEKKKKIITENPYRKKNEYEFGDSTLENNPILHPENNMKYNKYFKDFYTDISINDINNNNNIKLEVNDYCNNYNDYKYNNGNNKNYRNNSFNYKNENNGNNLTINGSNIMNNYKVDISKYNIHNNNKLSRNVSDLYDYKTSKINFNINSQNNNQSYINKILNNSKRRFSQNQLL